MRRETSPETPVGSGGPGSAGSDGPVAKGGAAKELSYEPAPDVSLLGPKEQLSNPDKNVWIIIFEGELIP